MRSSLLAWSVALLAFALGSVGVAAFDLANGHVQSPLIAGYLELPLFLAVGAVVASRRPRNPIGWIYLAGMFLIGIGGTNNFADQYVYYAVVTRPGSLPAVEWVAWLREPALDLGFFGMVTLTLLLFPNGQLPSQRWRSVLVGAIGAVVLGSILQAIAPEMQRSVRIAKPLELGALAGLVRTAQELDQLIVLLIVVASVAAPLVRFRSARGAERQQLKWFAYGTAWIPAVALAGLGLSVIAPDVFGGVVGDLWPLSVAGLPVATAIAILRYRLYDIDLLINRTLVYGATTAAIAATFFAGVLALQPLLRPLTSGSELAVACSTLVSFALFQPIRRRVQDTLDRRFDRSRYDAGRTLDAFADRLRDEVDLGTVRTDLIGAVSRTMSPSHTSIWLRDRAGMTVDLKSSVGGQKYLTL